MRKYYNIDGSSGVTVELIAPRNAVTAVNSLAMTNTHAANTATLSLFIQTSPKASASSTFYIIKNVSIPAGVTLLLDNPNLLSFNNKTNGYGLYATVGSSDTVDVLIS